jgi:GntR family transcriptional regulator/MocR family aminotransferase
LYDAIRNAILDGRLKRGMRLPATRDFSLQYGVSRRVVVNVFEQLQAEGYVTSRVGSGTRVTDQLPEDVLEVPRRSDVETKPASQRVLPEWVRPARPFRPIEPALANFPMDIWTRVAARRLRRVSPSILAGGAVQGYAPLREAIADYLATSRGIDCSADEVVVVSGVQQALDLVARFLVRSGDAVWVEDPGYVGAVSAFKNAGARIIPVPVDTAGLEPAKGERACSTPRAIYVTPAHQFPLGVTMSLERRLHLLSFARSCSAVVIEDDYDSEFRFSGRPVPALRGLDKAGSVILAGSFNKVLFPSLRLGYVLLPAPLVDRFLAFRFQVDAYPPSLSQAVMCDFMVEGHFGRHLRRMRELYSSRLSALQESATRYLRGTIELPNIQAGLNVPAYLRNGMTSRDAAEKAASAGIEVMSLDRFTLRKRDPGGFLLGFAAFEESEIRKGVLTLARALEVK